MKKKQSNKNRSIEVQEALTGLKALDRYYNTTNPDLTSEELIAARCLYCRLRHDGFRTDCQDWRCPFFENFPQYGPVDLDCMSLTTEEYQALLRIFLCIAYVQESQ